jgi:hypothetical protein
MRQSISEEINGMHPLDKAARIAGGLYVLEALVGPFSLVYVPSALFVNGNAAATAGNILAHETLFRFGIVGDLLTATLGLFVTLALYRLFNGVNHSLAALMVILGGFMVVPIYFMNSLNWVAALLLVRGADFLAAFDTGQRYALAMLFIRLHSQGHIVNGIFWGLWLFPFGLLVVKSGFLPRFLGFWLILNGFAYLMLSLTGLLLPQYHDALSNILFPVLFGEVAIALWLLIRGAKVKPPNVPAYGKLRQ